MSQWPRIRLFLTCLLSMVASVTPFPSNRVWGSSSAVQRQLQSRSSILFSSSTPDDESMDSDDASYLYYRPQSRPALNGGSFAYSEPNIRRSANTFLSIRSVGGVDCTNDVYARVPNRFEYWYIGKIARTDGTVKLEEAISRCWNMMEEHAVRLRPVELGREFGNLDIWIAGGDSELVMSQAVAGNVAAGAKSIEKMNLRKMEREVTGSDKVKLLEVGFMAEYVTNTGQGFYIVRDDQGKIMQ